MSVDVTCLISKFKEKICCGIDEVGRGPLAGPVVAAAVILPVDFFSSEIRDSKKLKRQKIKELATFIKANALSYSIALKEAKFIDDNDILTATFLAMEEAVLKLSIKPDVLFIDGNLKNPFLKKYNQIAVVGGDDKVPLISAASIIAKDYRDTLMEEYAKIYPQYCFEKHKGYGTSLHRMLIEKFGLSPIHRKSFCKGINSNNVRLL